MAVWNHFVFQFTLIWNWCVPLELAGFSGGSVQASVKPQAAATPAAVLTIHRYCEKEREKRQMGKCQTRQSVRPTIEPVTELVGAYYRCSTAVLLAFPEIK